MLVQDVMQSRLVTATPRTTALDALRLTSVRGIRHLLVVDGDRLVGIVSDRDLKRAMAPPASDAIAQDRSLAEPLARIMTRDVLTIEPTAPVEDAARVMLTERISALPVTDGDRLVGIVTETDVLRLFVTALGATEPSSRVDVAMGPDPSTLGDIVGAVMSTGTGISSLVTLTNKAGVKEAIVRLTTINPGAAITALTDKGYAVRTPWRGADTRRTR